MYIFLRGCIHPLLFYCYFDEEKKGQVIKYDVGLIYSFICLEYGSGGGSFYNLLCRVTSLKESVFKLGHGAIFAMSHYYMFSTLYILIFFINIIISMCVLKLNNHNTWEKMEEIVGSPISRKGGNGGLRCS